MRLFEGAEGLETKIPFRLYKRLPTLRLTSHALLISITWVMPTASGVKHVSWRRCPTYCDSHIAKVANTRALHTFLPNPAMSLLIV